MHLRMTDNVLLQSYQFSLGELINDKLSSLGKEKIVYLH